MLMLQLVIDKCQYLSMFGRNKEPKPQSGCVLETGWYLPPSPDPYNARTPADKAEEARLLHSEDFFGIVGMAMGQIPVPEGTTLQELASQASERAAAGPDPQDY